MSKSIFLLSLLFSAICQAEGYEFEVTSPKFKVTIPNLPQMKMEEHPMHATQPYLRFIGSEVPYTISILTPTADKGMTALDCASSTIQQLPKRPGVPELNSIYKARLDDTTFIALYAIPFEGFVQFNAHILSGTNGYCIEAHASRISTSKDDVDAWFGGFSNAHIEPN